MLYAGMHIYAYNMPLPWSFYLVDGYAAATNIKPRQGFFRK